MSRSTRSTRIALVALVLLLAGPPPCAPAATGQPAPRLAHAARHRKVVPPHHHHHRRKPASRPKPAAASQSAPTAPLNCTDGDLLATAANLDRVRAATFCLVDQQRAAHGLAPLRDDPVLDAAAQSHSADMVAGDYFDHAAPDGSGPLDRVLAAGFAGLDGSLGVAENIATASGSLATPAATVADWMASPGHRANILGAYSSAGIGVVAATPALLGSGGQGATYTEDFAAAG